MARSEFFAALCLISTVSTFGFSQVATLHETAKSTPDQFPSNRAYGHAVANGVGLSAVSAIRDDTNGEDSGVVYSYITSRDGGLPTAEMYAPDADSGDQFGWSLGMMGTSRTQRLLVGAPGDDDLGEGSGAVYLFQPQSGFYFGKYLASDGHGGDQFGFSTAIYFDGPDMFDPDFAVIGALTDSPGENAGAVYIIDLETGQETMKLQPDEIGAFDEFGYSVATNGDLIVVGAPGDEVGGVRAGAVYVFDADTGEQLQRFTASDGHDGARFGHAVALDNYDVYIGAPGQVGGGAGYSFRASSGVLQFVISSIDEYVDELGWSVSVGNQLVCFGAPGDDQIVEDGGSVIVCSKSGYVLDKHITEELTEHARFGSSLMSKQSDDILIGSPGSDVYGPDTGAVYRYGSHLGDVSFSRFGYAPRGFEHAGFGMDVDIDDGLTIIGAPTDTAVGYRVGSASIVDATSGEMMHKLFPFDADDEDFFGKQVAIEGDIAAVSSESVHEGIPTQYRGAVYVYAVSDGSLMYKLEAPEISSGGYAQWYGRSLAMHGQMLYVSAAFSSVGSNWVGLVYQYDAYTGTLVRVLQSTNPGSSRFFGNFVTIGDGVLAVSSYTNHNRPDQYITYELFEVSSGDFVGMVHEIYPGLEEGDVITLAMGDGYLVVRTVNDEIIVYDMDTAMMLGEIESPSMQLTSEFGWHFEIDQAKLAVSDFGETSGGGVVGPAYVFDLSTQELEMTLDPDIVDGDGMYQSLAFEGGMAVLGIPNYSDFSSTVGPGGVFIFDVNEVTCQMDFNGDRVVNFFDVSAFLIAFTNEDMEADLNSDGMHNFFDLSIFLIGYIEGCI